MGREEVFKSPAAATAAATAASEAAVATRRDKAAAWAAASAASATSAAAAVEAAAAAAAAKGPVGALDERRMLEIIKRMNRVVLILKVRTSLLSLNTRDYAVVNHHSSSWIKFTSWRP